MINLPRQARDKHRDNSKRELQVAHAVFAGDRGKLMLPEAVPFQPTPEPAPAPAPAPKRAPAPAPAPAPARALAPAPATGTPSLLNVTPSMQSSPTPVAVRQEVARAVGPDSEGSFSEIVAFMREERCERVLFWTFYIENRSFNLDRLGINMGKVEKRGPFSQGDTGVCDGKTARGDASSVGPRAV
jgi:hypothetical protein